MVRHYFKCYQAIINDIRSGCTMPLASMFILFESIVHDPTQNESNHNLLFLDMAAGYFGRLEYESGGSLEGSIFSEFTLLARDFVRKEQNINISVGSDIRVESTNAGPFHNVPVDVNGVSSRVPPSHIISQFLFTAVSGQRNPNWDNLQTNQMSTSPKTDNLVCSF
jgi:hypothetical protein